MSLIFGVNLSDRIYISADTRLTKNNPDGSKTYKDNLIKVVPLSSGCVVATAGKLKISQFIVNKLLKDDLIKQDIRTIREKILCKIRSVVDEFLSADNQYNDVKACLLFGGLNSGSKKLISGGKALIDLVGECQELDKGPTASLMNKLFDPAYKELHRPIVEVLSNGGQTMKNIMFDGLQASQGRTDGMIEIKHSDSHIFAVLLNGNEEPIIEDANWSEFLAYGPKGITKDKISREAFCRLEFRKGQLGHDKALITAIIQTTADEHSLDSVGDHIFSVVLSDFGKGVLTGDVHGIDMNTGAKYFSKIIATNDGVCYAEDENGTRIKLISVHEYKDADYISSELSIY